MFTLVLQFLRLLLPLLLLTPFFSCYNTWAGICVYVLPKTYEKQNTIRTSRWQVIVLQSHYHK